MNRDSQIIVIKYGGHALTDTGLARSFCQSLKQLSACGFGFVIVHGGGPQINEMLARLAIEPVFVNGLRKTDSQTLAVVEMILCGSVNKHITRLLTKSGIAACGISGEDGGLFRATLKDPALGSVGSISGINPALPRLLLSGGYVPVVAPLALDAAGEPLNINADTAAGALAAAIGAKAFVLVSDVPGVLDDQGNLLRCLNPVECGRLKREGVITGGMIPKTEACLNALEQGCPRAIILDGSKEDNLALCLAEREFQGTVFTMGDLPLKGRRTA